MKVGDYVRTKSGIIGKIKSKNYIGYNDWIIDTLYYNNDEIINDWTCGIKEYDIIKSSSNIIDLISYGDIVKYKIDGVLFISEVWGEENDYFIQNFDVQIDIKDLEIISIVTREQFERMQYKVGE